MPLVDLTLAIPAGAPSPASLERRRIQTYTAQIYHFRHDSMVGTYLDLPGHILETDDGLDAATYPLDGLYRVPATVVRLDRRGGSGAVTAAELEAACPRPVRGRALILNALGRRRFDAIAEFSVWLAKDARAWIAARRVRLLVSDIYESRPLDGVFLDLFRAGIATVCYPVNLAAIAAPYVRLTVLPARFETVTQLPCRVVAEWEARAARRPRPSRPMPRRKEAR